MKAFVLRADSFKMEEIAVPEIGKNEVLVRLKYAALNHRDEWIRAGSVCKNCVSNGFGLGWYGRSGRIGC
jgi:NADPH:quinone reductase-like Zn-dependent oxidoreductase